MSLHRREAIQALVDEMFSPEGERIIQEAFPVEDPEGFQQGMELGRRHKGSLVACLLESELGEDTARGLVDALGHVKELLRVIKTPGFQQRYQDHLRKMGLTD